jgi:molybdopterin converting factor small subunit/CDP-diglyceride synthetase
MAVLRLFASAREAAGLSVDRIDGATVGEILDEARRRYGEQFAAVLTHSRVWVNGAPADVRAALREGDVVAVLPPVSGGSDTATVATAMKREPLEEPLPFTKPESDKSESGWFRPHDVTAPEFEGSLARLTKPQPVDETSAAQLNGDRRAAAAEREPLSVVPDTDKPHVRLGIVWLIVTVAAVAGGRPTLGVWMSAMAAVAAVQVTKAWMERHERPVSYVAVGGAAALPLAAIGGLETLNILVVLTVVVTMVARISSPTKAPSRDVALTLMIIFPIGLATAAPVLLRTLGVAAPLALFAFAAAHDMGAYLVGTGAASEWEGPIAGIASIFCVTLFVAVLVPSFDGGSPFLLGFIAAVLAPLGPLAASIVLGDRDAKAPALRRLDSLLLLAPVWAWLAAVLLH